MTCSTEEHIVYYKAREVIVCIDTPHYTTLLLITNERSAAPCTATITAVAMHCGMLR